MRGQTVAVLAARAGNGSGAYRSRYSPRAFRGLVASPVQRLSPDVYRAHMAIGMAMRVRGDVDRYLFLREIATRVMSKGNDWRMVGEDW